MLWPLVAVSNALRIAVSSEETLTE